MLLTLLENKIAVFVKLAVEMRGGPQAEERLIQIGE